MKITVCNICRNEIPSSFKIPMTISSPIGNLLLRFELLQHDGMGGSKPIDVCPACLSTVLDRLLSLYEKEYIDTTEN